MELIYFSIGVAIIIGILSWNVRIGLTYGVLAFLFTLAGFVWLLSDPHGAALGRFFVNVVEFTEVILVIPALMIAIFAVQYCLSLISSARSRHDRAHDTIDRNPDIVGEIARHRIESSTSRGVARLGCDRPPRA